MPVTVKDINWRDCEKMNSYTFLTDMQHVVRIKKHSIPIVFIPGIMGSRLINNDGKAWDPDDKTFMATSFIMTGAETHKKILIDHPHAVIHHPPPAGAGTADAADQKQTSENAEKQSADDKVWLKKRFAEKLKVLLSPTAPGWQWLPIRADVTGDARVQQAAQILVDHGWGEIALGFYEQFLFVLGGANFRQLERCFCFPVYARGYNWVGSNDDSGAYLSAQIQDIIKAEKAIPGRECDRVIIVSHSMGGLASRSAMKLHGLEASCFGAAHGAQPATGAPEAYREMRGGAQGTFDPSAYVIGHTSALVMPVLANCAGGLELLPNRRYRTNGGQAAWLQQTGKDGKTMGKALPAGGDPYGEIYKADAGFLRLLLHPELLDPGGTQRERRTTKAGTAQKPLDKAKALISNADAFHKKLNTLHHGKTAVAYGQSGPPTYDVVTYAYERDYQKREVYNHGEVMAYRADSNSLEGSGADLDGSAWYLIDGKKGQGDGTVPHSSGGSLPPTFRKAYQTNGPAHSAFYSDAGVQQFTVDTIALLAEQYRKQEVGK